MNSHLRYRADIDGLRAFSVIAVFLFHLNLQLFSGGYVGVDVFFVISGYLITQIIKNEFQQNGKFSFFNFYIRRARRLIPAFYFTVLLTLIAGTILLSQTHLLLLGKSAVSSILFMSNFWFWNQSGYFDIDAFMKPLLHTWSLSVEEQYYLFWPSFLILLLKLKSRKLSVFLFLLAAFTSFGLNPLFSSGKIPFLSEAFPKISRHFDDGAATIFFLPFFRFFEFLIGAAIVWLPEKKIMNAPKLLELSACFGFVCLFYSIFTYTDKTIFPSFHALCPCIGAALLIIGGRAPITGIMLRNSLATWIGKRSYSLYLVHWPLIVFVKYWKFGNLNAVEQLSIFIVAFLISNFMFHYIEKPFRTTRSTNPTSNHVLFLSVNALFFVSLLTVSISTTLQNGWDWRIPAERRVISDLVYRSQETAYCGGKENSTSLFTCVNNKHASKSIFIWGDSHSRHLIPGFSKAFPNHNIKVLYLSSCLPQSGLFGYFYDYEGRERLAQECVTRNRNALAYFKKIKPTNIIFQSYHYVGDAKNEGLLHATLALKKALLSHGHNVKILSDVIRPDKPLTDCSAVPRIYSDKRLKTRCVVDMRIAQQLIAEDSMIEKELGRDVFINMREALCNTNTCIGFLGKKPLFRDAHHLSILGSEYFVSKAKQRLNIV